MAERPVDPTTETSARTPVLGAGERSARRILMIDAALLIVIVVVVHLAFVAQDGQPPFPPWSVGLSWCAALVTLTTGIAARWLPDAALRALAWAAVVGYWLTLVSFPAAVPPEGIDRIPWVLSASGAAAAAALVAGGRRLAWITVGAGTAAGLGYRALFGGLDLTGVVNDLQALLTGAVICVIGGHILSVGRGLDQAAARTTEAVERESAERGRLAARARAASLVHDEVLATLNLAASTLPIPRAMLAEQAARTAGMVTRLVDAEAGQPVVLRVALAEEARRHDAVFTVRGDPPATIDPVIQEALLGATRQALRNSVQHAPGSTRTVTLENGTTGIRVRIADDGPGFDPGAVADDRLGIRQSIVGRMARVAGGHAEVVSGAGTSAGTLVLLDCAAEPERELDASGDRGALRTGLAAVAVVYVVTQTASALMATAAAPASWPVNAAVLVIALVAAEILRRSPDLTPTPGRTALVTGLSLGGLVVGASSVPFSYGTMWFAVAFAFLFVAIALRGRMRVALAGGGLIVAVLVLIGLSAGSPTNQIVQVTARLVVLIALAAAILVVVERMQLRIAALHRETLASAERESWTLGARSELAARVADLGRTVVPLLGRIAAGDESTPADRREYAAWEGELRDSLRAGALVQEPLTAVVAAARERGVDVVLLDDSGGSMPDHLVDPVLHWMAAALRTAKQRAVGRLLPPGRDARASATVDGRHTEFAQGAVSSFQGE